jgi:hypothetical protein
MWRRRGAQRIDSFCLQARPTGEPLRMTWAAFFLRCTRMVRPPLLVPDWIPAGFLLIHLEDSDPTMLNPHNDT